MRKSGNLGSLLALTSSPRWRSRTFSGVFSFTAITRPFLVERLDESRATSLRRHYPTSSVLLAPATSRLLNSDFGCPYTEPLQPSPATSEISRITQHNFPHIPSRRPRKVHLLRSVNSTDGFGLPHLTTGSALSMTSYEALWVPWWYGLRVCDSSSEKVFSIHSVLRVASQNRIFASRVYRKIPCAGL
jgi:hypothetical protein